jgi:hypothetical protein
MLRDPRIRRDLPLRAAGYASRNADPSAPVRVVVFAEPLSSATGLASAAAGLFDPQGRLVSEWRVHGSQPRIGTDPRGTRGPSGHLSLAGRRHRLGRARGDGRLFR